MLATILGLISWQEADRGPLLTLDTDFRGDVQGVRRTLHSGFLDGIGHLLADLGNATLAIPVLLGLAVLAAWRLRRARTRRWWLPLPVAVLTAVAIPLLVVPAKEYFARPGPLGDPLLPGQLGWYPSGHTATSAIAYGTAALLLGRTAHRPIRLYRATALLCFGVGAGLLWSDFHWLLDVIASWCLSGLVLLGQSAMPPGARGSADLGAPPAGGWGRLRRGARPTRHGD